MGELVLANLSRKFGAVEAVKDVSLSIHDGEFVVFLGPSGCGKTTTLRMIAGLEEITSGEIHLDGRRLNDILPAERDIAMVFQNYALYPHMTAYKTWPSLEDAGRYASGYQGARSRAADILAISHLLDRYPRALSGRPAPARCGGNVMSAIPACFSSMSRYRIWMRSCVPRPGWN